MASAGAFRPLLRTGARLLVQQQTWSTPAAAAGQLRGLGRGALGRARPSSVCLSCTLRVARLRLYSTSQPPSRQSDRDSELEAILASASKPKPSASEKDDQPSSTDTSSAPSLSTPPPPRDQPPSSSSSSSSSSQDPSSSSSAELPSTAESRRSPLSARFSTLMDNLQSRVFVASQTLNDLTGYSAIDAIKARNAHLETALSAAQQRLRAARRSYQSVHERRATTQREVTTLLARKDTWSPADLERFTSLYRLDHELESGVSRAASDLTEAEADEARLSAELTAGILKRYHEEQVWSDRIRRQSTWGTWGLMGVNVLLFLVLQFVAEPWKRRRLMRSMADREAAVLEEVRQELSEVKMALGMRETSWTSPAAVDAEEAIPTVGAAVAVGEEQHAGETAGAAVNVPDGIASPWPETKGSSWKDFLTDTQRWKPAMLDLYSERLVAFKMRDASLIALEGAVAGATMAAGVVFLLLRRT